MKLFIYALFAIAATAQLALADAPVIWNGTTAKWLPSGLKSAGMCKLSSTGVMTSGQADLTSNVTGVLPLANGGTNKNMTAVNGGLVYSDADSLEVTSAGTSGQAVLSGGAGAPTFFAPTVGSVIFAGTSGILDEENSVLFYDKTNNRLGIGTTVPSGTLDVTNTADSIRGNIVLWGQGKAANSEWIIYDSPIGDVSLYNPNQAVYGWSCRATGGCAIGTYALGSGNQMLGIKNNAGEEAKHTLVVQNVPSQTGDAFRHFASDATTVLSKVDVAGKGFFSNIRDTALGAGIVHSDSSGDFTSSAVVLTSEVSGVLPLANGGTNKNMTAVNGGVVWTDADSMEVIAAGTSGQVLQSNGSAAPTWVTPTDTGITQLTGDVTAGPGSGSQAATIANLAVTNAKIANSTIDLTAKVTGVLPNANTTAASANTLSAIVARDGSGDFSAGTITAALTGNASTSSALAANPSDCSANQFATTIAANGNLTCAAVAAADLPAPNTSTISAVDIDWSTLKNVDGLYTKTLSGNITLTFSNVTAGQTVVIALTNTASNYTLGWPAAAKWPGGTAPTQTIGAKTDVYTCKAYDSTNAYCSVVQNF